MRRPYPLMQENVQRRPRVLLLTVALGFWGHALGLGTRGDFSRGEDFLSLKMLFGSRNTLFEFSYTYHDKNHGAIHQSIEALDRLGMEIIETGDPDAFKQYLQEYENTICGRHPISVLLHMLKHCSTKIKVGFVRYEQSSQCKSMRDSSVSYASAAAKVDSPGDENKD